MPKFLNKNNGGPCYKCTIRLLEDTKVLECEFQANHKGRYVLDYTCNQLNLIERDYFGIRFVDLEKQRHWLDPVKSILKQIKDIDQVLFSFRVKFYPPNPFQLKEKITRYQIYLQLRRDLLHGRLYCSSEDAALLGAYILQADLGDYNPQEHVGNYASEFKIFLKQTLNMEEEMMEIHQTELKGQSPEEAEANFLRKACMMESYGLDPHLVKDQKGNQVYLGVNFNGILVFQGNRKVSHFRWNEVQKINYEGKMFIIHLIYMEDPRTKKKETVGFKCPTATACRYVWRCAIEQMLFFTSPSSSNVPRVVSGGGFFSGSKFRYTGRVEREVLEETAQLSRTEPQITRVGSFRKKSSSVPATPSTPIVNDLEYNTSPRLNFSSFENRSNYVGDSLNVQFSTDGSAILEPVVEDSEIPSNKYIKKRADAVDATCNNNNNNNNHNNNNNNYNNEKEATQKKVISNSGNFKESYSESTLYYNRDPVDHSSSESHMTGSASHRSSRSQTPVPKGNVHFLSNMGAEDRYQSPINKISSDYRSYEGDSSFCARVGSFCKACLPSIILTITSLFVVMVIAFEMDTEFFALLRRAPEMVSIRRQYYEPAKEQIKLTVNQMLNKLQF